MQQVDQIVLRDRIQERNFAAIGIVLALIQGIANASGLTFVQKLTPADPAAGKVFGNAVAMSGNATLFVGAYGDSVGGQTDAGAVYVFERVGNTWTEVQKLQDPERSALDNFGFSVAVQNDIAVIGAHRDDGLRTDQGSAAVFRRVANTWSFMTRLVANDPGTTDQFGHSVAIDGDSIIVGSRWDDVGANADQGSAHVFVRSADGNSWSPGTQLPTPSSLSGGDEFGYSVAIRGNVAVVGARLDDVGVNPSQGGVFTYSRNSQGAWSQIGPTLTAPVGDAQAGDLFGSTVELSLDGSVLAVGAQSADPGESGIGVGAVYVYEWNGSAWQMLQKLEPFNPNQGEQLGSAVAISQFQILAGGFGENLVGSQSGAAYDYQRSGSGELFTGNLPQIAPAPGQNGANFGEAVALSGGHVAIGAWLDDNTSLSNAGAVYMYSGFPKVPTVVQLSASAARVEVNATVTLTAVVTGGGPRGEESGGSVEFRDGGAVITCATVSEMRTSQQLTITCSTAGLPVGTRQLTANYSGDIERASSVSGTLSLPIDPPAISLAPSTLPVALLGASYSQNITATGSSKTPFSFAHPNDTLPPGLSLVSSTGQLVGVPSASGSFSFAVQATDGSAACVSPDEV